MCIRPLLIALPLCATACADFPELAPFDATTRGDYPELLPMEDLAGPPPRPVDDLPGATLQSRGDALRQRATASPGTEAEALRARAAALRARAAALQNR